MPSSIVHRPSSKNWQLVPLGDAALLVTAVVPDAKAVAQLVALAHDLERLAGRRVALNGVEGWTLGFDTLLITYDPLATDASRLERWLLRQLSTLKTGAQDAAKQIEIPVRYGGADGPDLLSVAAATELRADQVIALHMSGSYQVLMIGFAPGFPYIGGLPQQLQLPRRDVPRTDVPSGSIAIAGDMVGIYPQRSPGGWHLIGRTDVILFEPHRDPPALLQPGDRVRFVQV